METSTPILICAKFQASLYLEFNTVQVGSTSTKIFQLRNPNNRSIKVSIERVPEKYGFQVSLGSGLDQKFIEIEPLESATGYVHWFPTKDTAVRESVILKLDDKVPLQLTLHGVAGLGLQQPEKSQQTVSSKIGKKISKCTANHASVVDQFDTDHSSVSTTKTKKLISRISTASSKSESTKLNKNKKAINKTDATNWTENQSASFVSFMNFTFQNHHTLPAHLNDSKWTQIKHNIQLSFYNKLQSYELEERQPETTHQNSSLFSLLMTEIDSNKLAIRTDKNICADVGLQKAILDMIFSYELPWIRLGFEYILRHENSNIQWDSAAVNSSGSGNESESEYTMSGRSTRASSIGSYDGIDEPTNGHHIIDDEDDFDIVSVLTRMSVSTATAGEMIESMNKDIAEQDYFQLICSNILNCVHSPQKQINQLKKIFYNKILNNSTIQQEYEKKNPLLTPHVDAELKHKLKQSFLKKILLLIHFLDQVKCYQILPLPRLFKKESKFKSSKDVLINLCQELIQAENNFIQHLFSLNYTVRYEQTYMDEFDYEINNFSADLRDGVRLGKFIDIITYNNKVSSILSNSAHQSVVSTAITADDNAVYTNNASATTGATTQTQLSRALRVPAVSRLQKIHNVVTCLRALNELIRDHDSATVTAAGGGGDSLLNMSISATPGFTPGISVIGSANSSSSAVESVLLQNAAKLIVDGDVNATVLLLWRIMHSLNLKQLVSCDDVHREVKRLSNQTVPHYFQAMLLLSYTVNDCDSDCDSSAVTTRTLSSLFHYILSNASPATAAANAVDNTNTASASASVNEYLLIWINLIVSLYTSGVANEPVSDFSSAFADGSVLCYILHFYHPQLLPLKHIHHTYALNSNENDVKTIECQHHNFKTFKRVCKQLGGIPLLSSNYDRFNPPDNLTIEFLIIYLFSKLMISSVQMKAATKIQKIFRFKYQIVLNKLALKRKKHANKHHSKRSRDSPDKLNNIGDNNNNSNNSNGSLDHIPVSIYMSKHCSAKTIQNVFRHHKSRRSSLHMLDTCIEEVNETMIDTTAPTVDDTTTTTSSNNDDDSTTSLYSIQALEISPETIIPITLPEEYSSAIVQENSTANTSDTYGNANTNTSGLRNFQFIPKRHVFVPKRVKVNVVDDDVFSPKECSSSNNNNNNDDTDDKENVYVSRNKSNILKNIMADNSSSNSSEDNDVGKLKSGMKSCVDTSSCNASSVVSFLSMSPARPTVLCLSEEESVSTSFLLATTDTDNAVNANAADIDIGYYTTAAVAAAITEPSVTVTIDETKLKQDLSQEYQALYDTKLIETERAIAEKLRSEYEIKLKLNQENMENEHELRLLMENQMKLEYEKRMDLEKRLNQYEVEQMIRKQIEKENQDNLNMLLYKQSQAKSFLQNILLKYIYKRRYANIRTRIIRIQSVWRMITTKKCYYQLKITTSLIQALWRKILLSRKMVSMNNKASFIQFIWNGYQTRKHYTKQIQNCITIQSFIRSYRAHKQYIQIQQSIIKIQSCVRNYLNHQQLMKSYQLKLQLKNQQINRAVRIIQKNIKLYLRNKYLQQLNEHAFAKRMKLLKSICILNQFMKVICSRKYRLYKAGRVVLRWYKAYIPLMKARKLRVGITRLQAVIKGYIHRHHFTESVELRYIRERILQAENHANKHPENKLFTRTTATLQAIELDTMNKTYLDMNKYCLFLYTATLYSSVCGELVSEQCALTSFMALIKSCSRSVPHQELLCVALCVLLNIVSLNTEALADSEITIEVLVDVMQMFRDVSPVFCLASEVLSRVLSVSTFAQIQFHNDSNEYKKRLQSIVEILERKHRLEERVRSLSCKASTSTSTTTTATATTDGSGITGGSDITGGGKKTLMSLTDWSKLIRLPHFTGNGNVNDSSSNNHNGNISDRSEDGGASIGGGGEGADLMSKMMFRDRLTDASLLYARHVLLATDTVAATITSTGTATGNTSHVSLRTLTAVGSTPAPAHKPPAEPEPAIYG